MKFVPSMVKKLNMSELAALEKFLDSEDSVVFRSLVKHCMAATKDRIIGTRPSMDDSDMTMMFDLGYQRGVLEAHQMYLNLLSSVKDEIENRKEKEKSEQLTAGE